MQREGSWNSDSTVRHRQGETQQFAPELAEIGRPGQSAGTDGHGRTCFCRAAAQESGRSVAIGHALFALFLTTVVCASHSRAEEPVRLECTPRVFRVVPGEPMRLEMTVRASSAAGVRLHVPGNRLLKLRAVEKLPVKRTRDGKIVHKRVVVWQALEPGSIKLDKMWIETGQRKLFFPDVTITVRDPGP